jgi:DNA-binding GntR family transcriptional regulator
MTSTKNNLPFPNLGNKTLPAQFSPYVRIKDMIYRGQLPGGKRLVERDLSSLLAISRIPLREALIRLQSEGLVSTIRNTGTYVVDFSPKDLAEIYSLRRILEPFAARLAAERRDKRQLLQDLREICTQMTELSTRDRDWDKLDECDFEFHWTIVLASQHSRLIRAYEMSQIRILGRRDEYRYLMRTSPTATAEIHLKLVDVIASGNGIKAEKANYEHVNYSMQQFIRSHGLPKG